MEGVEKIIRHYRLFGAFAAIKTKALIAAYKEKREARIRASQSVQGGPSVKMEPQEMLTSATQEILEVKRGLTSPPKPAVDANPFQLSSDGAKSSSGDVEESSVCKLEAQTNQSVAIKLEEMLAATETKVYSNQTFKLEQFISTEDKLEGYDLQAPKLLYQSVQLSDNDNTLFGEGQRPSQIKILDNTESIERQNEVVEKFLNKPMRSTTAEKSDDLAIESSAETLEIQNSKIEPEPDQLFSKNVPKASEDSVAEDEHYMETSESDSSIADVVRGYKSESREAEKQKLNEALQSIKRTLDDLPICSNSSIVEEMPAQEPAAKFTSSQKIQEQKPTSTQKSPLKLKTSPVVNITTEDEQPDKEQSEEGDEDLEENSSEEDIENPTSDPPEEQETSSDTLGPRAPMMQSPTLKPTLPAPDKHRVKIREAPQPNLKKKKGSSGGLKSALNNVTKRVPLSMPSNPKRKVHQPYGELQASFLKAVLKAGPPEGFPDWNTFEIKLNSEFYLGKRLNAPKGREPGRPKGRKSDKSSQGFGFEGNSTGWEDSSWVNSFSSQQKESVEVSDGTNPSAQAQFPQFGDSSGESGDVRLPMQYMPQQFDPYSYPYPRVQMIPVGMMPLPKPKNRF